MRDVREVTVSNWVSRIAALQDREGYSEQHWEGSFEEYLALVRQNPKVTRTAFQRVYDMILSHGKTEYIDNKKKLIRYNFFTDPDFGGKDAIYGLDIPLMKLVNVFKSAAQMLRDREARHPPARPGRLVQVDHRPPAQEGPRGVLEDGRGRALHVRVGHRAHEPRGAAAARGHALPDARGAAAPRAARVARRGVRGARSARVRPHDPGHGRPLPGVPLRLQGPHDGVQGRLGEGDGPRPRAPADPLREGPRRHRHVPAQGREEPGLDRAHRRHQLPQDRRVRLRLRPARVQLRRRVQHREPRHHRVRRDPEARRGVPLRPARRHAGAQDQAEEVPADRHRRGHHRAHERARVQEAPVERVHGGAPGSHRQDRHPVHHPARRGGEDLRARLQQPQDPREAHRPAHARDGRDVGACSPASRSRRSTTSRSSRS